MTVAGGGRVQEPLLVADAAANLLAEQEAHFLATMDAAQVGIFVVQDRLFKYVNPCFLRLFGFTAEELVDRKGPLDLIIPEQHPFVLDQMQLRAAGVSGHNYELTAVHQNGSTFPVQILGSPSSYGGRAASVGTLLDLSAQKAAERRIRELADFDPLTGLPNRRLLRDRFAQLLAAAEREEGEIALIFLDLDHFKRINDSLGHSVGDDLLCEVSGRLSAAVRRIDTLARLGGDEFIFALPGIHAAAAAEVARRLLDVCVTPFVVGGHELTITPSLGISIYPQDGKDLETLLKNADAAMYRAKEVGRNTFQFYASEMNTATLERLLMESNLRRALNQNEFVLYYQPLVNLQSGLIIGVEALIRWMHPDLGLIMPDRFIHVAEETGLINPIGDWVLCEACRQAQAWCDAGLPPITMAVNVAPVQFRQAGFVAVVAGALATSGLEAARLELEVTERTVMYDADINLGTLSALHRMGVELSLDDFGTGYSSLAYLKRFPVGKLKIDRSFINDLEVDSDDRAIASTIVSMGRNLRLTVLAEGVENAEQLALLRQMGCDMAQGFHFSRALPAEAIARLLAEQPFLNKEA
ncbi:putative bifunctional diguanylate cyclase/phosphodiesterase [Quatrionicoccus australiensis]|uniref:putative bifunctional diguanylate cyclase/phosphodiesterase n=1 Tax=Quatrionicoccus australiensis TaxID=138118 RepID=UPI001CF9D305|nr:EAL domain-containing protein [Quatrionicoccus australiensis]MCB4359033.1 EAL domain-containing protein [Quatrionicoccus australiensis]